MPPVLLTCSVDTVSRPTTSSVLLRGVVGDGTISIGSEQSRLVVPGGTTAGLGAVDALGLVGGGALEVCVHPAAQQTTIVATMAMTVRITPLSLTAQRYTSGTSARPARPAVVGHRWSDAADKL